jgi:hypothetical protein
MQIRVIVESHGSFQIDVEKIGEQWKVNMKK